jgi:hypothetical protein
MFILIGLIIMPAWLRFRRPPCTSYYLELPLYSHFHRGSQKPLFQRPEHCKHTKIVSCPKSNVAIELEQVLDADRSAPTKAPIRFSGSRCVQRDRSICYIAFSKGIADSPPCIESCCINRMIINALDCYFNVQLFG